MVSSVTAMRTCPARLRVKSSSTGQSVRRRPRAVVQGDIGTFGIAVTDSLARCIERIIHVVNTFVLARASAKENSDLPTGHSCPFSPFLAGH
jgi:hypothetical protein